MESDQPITPEEKGNVVVFIPFFKSMIQEKDKKTTNLSTMAEFMKANFKNGSPEKTKNNKDRAFTIVTHPGDEGTQEIMRNLGPNDTLYIMGHGGTGVPSIDSNLTGDFLKESFGSDEVINRMRSAGVSENVGKIKLFTCHSAEGPGNTFLAAFEAERKKPVEAGKANYANAELTGYNGRLNTQDVHKTATVRDALGEHSIKRASAAAVHIPQRPG